MGQWCVYAVGVSSETRPGIVYKSVYTLFLRVLSRPEMGLPLVSGWGILTFAFPLEGNFQAIPKNPVAWEFPAFLAPRPLLQGGGNQSLLPS